MLDAVFTVRGEFSLNVCDYRVFIIGVVYWALSFEARLIYVTFLDYLCSCLQLAGCHHTDRFRMNFHHFNYRSDKICQYDGQSPEDGT